MNMSNDHRRSLTLQLKPELLGNFSQLFQEGIMLDVEVGCSITQLLVDQFGVPKDYIRNRITTLFLNSKAVDDAQTALVHDGSVLALSGAMPGLVGATMRSGGYYAAMRSSINYENQKELPAEKIGTIKIKLFNLIKDELGPGFLGKGILLPISKLIDVLHKQTHASKLKGQWDNGEELSVDFDNLKIAGFEDQVIKLKADFEN